MAGIKELETELKAMAEDFRLPGGGRMKLAQLVAGHLVWFDTAERRGLRWQDMIRLLTAAGVTGRGGKPLALQLRYRKFSESMGNHDSEIVDAGSVD